MKALWMQWKAFHKRTFPSTNAASDGWVWGCCALSACCACARAVARAASSIHASASTVPHQLPTASCLLTILPVSGCCQCRAAPHLPACPHLHAWLQDTAAYMIFRSNVRVSGTARHSTAQHSIGLGQVAAEWLPMDAWHRSVGCGSALLPPHTAASLCFFC
jgi:hypothetical protein